MAYQPNPNDPYRARPSQEEMRHQARLNSLDNELQADPELAEGPASGAKVAMFAVAIAVVLGAVFYGLNNTTVNQAGTAPPSQTAQQTSPANPAAPPGMRDVTPQGQRPAGYDHGRGDDQPSDAAGFAEHGYEQDHPAARRYGAGQQAVTIRYQTDVQRAMGPLLFYAPMRELARSCQIRIDHLSAGCLVAEVRFSAVASFCPASRRSRYGRSGRLHNIGFGLIHAPSEKHPIAARPTHYCLGRSPGFCTRIRRSARRRFRNWSDQAVHALQRERGSDVRIIAEDLCSGELMPML